jgi:putative DNA primase/helicase
MSDRLAERARGRWKSILMTLSVLDAKALSGADVPCAMCGGTDRFRYSDKGFGRWFCRSCGGGDGFKLIMAVRGVGFAEAARLVEGALNDSLARGAREWSDGRSGGGNGADRVNDPLKTWRSGVPFSGTLGDAYLRRRGIELTPLEAFPLRFKRKLFHWPSKTEWPCMVALVRMHDGTEITCHQTFIEEDGSSTARLLGDKRRLFVHCAPGALIGAGVWFGDADRRREFIVAEGIESTLSAMRLYGVWAGCAALSAIGVGKLVLPDEARKVRIFADHDSNGAGLAAAITARMRWRAEGREVAISHAREIGEDANDLWARRQRSPVHA